MTAMPLRPLRERSCLVLNADYRPLNTFPLSIISAQDAVSAIWRERADIVEVWPDAFFRSPSTSIPVPKIMALREYAPINGEPRFCRRSILLRDRFRCFAAGTRILMADGQQIPIEHIKVGDRVVDAYGTVRNVTVIGNRIADDCLSIKHRGSFQTTIVTADHPFLTDGGEFESIGNIKIGEGSGGRRGGYLMFPRLISYELPAPIELNTATLLPTDRWFRMRSGRIYRTRKRTDHGLPLSIMHSPHLSYLLGLYVAEGSATHSGLVAWSFAANEYDTLAADVHRIAWDVFGLPIARDINPARNTCVARVGSQSLAGILRTNCGSGAKNKRAPWRLIGPYHADFLRGLFLGDATFDDARRKVALTMTGHQAILDAQSMLWGLGIYPTLQFGERDGRRSTSTLVLNARNWSRFMNTVLRCEVPDAEPIFGDENYVFRKLQTRTPADGEYIVYNIEVDGSHSYIANGIAVHNCQYCGARFESPDLTYDHVIPRSAGGKTVWSNIVTACIACNAAKANSLPAYNGRKRITGAGRMRPLKEPRQPTTAELLRAGLEFLPNDVRESWGDWLYWNASLKP